jgi:hypothetical protein
MNKKMEMQRLEKIFQDYEKSFEFIINEYTGRIKWTEYSKGWYYNIYPLENEIDGFNRGKLLKNKPSKLCKVTEYGFDNNGKIILIIEHVTPEIRNYSFISYRTSYINIYKYVGGIPLLQNITTVILSENETINSLYNYGKYGFRVDTYFYNSIGKIDKMHREAKEHVSDQLIECDFLFKYDDSKLNEIQQFFPNGYNKIIYKSPNKTVQ